MRILQLATVTIIALAAVGRLRRTESQSREGTGQTPAVTENAPRVAQQHLYREIVDARMASVEKRGEQLATRASVLIASAALSASLETTASDNGWTILSVLLALAAAGFGVLTLFPKKSDYVSLQSLRQQLLKLSPSNAELLHADEQASTYESRVKSLNSRGWSIRIGFSLLAASIIARAALALNITITIG